jgi:hypothetical protein
MAWTASESRRSVDKELRDNTSIIYDISPTATPFLSALERVPVISTKHS